MKSWLERVRRAAIRFGWRFLVRLGWRPRYLPAVTVLNSIVRHAEKPQDQAGRLRFFRADQAVVLIGDVAAVHKVVQFGFYSRDGGVYVQSPYFGKREGIVAALTRDPKHTGSKETFDLTQGGKLALEHFKLSHHANGFVHFSQSGWEKTDISRQSFRLGDQRGLVCELTFGPVTAFSEALENDRKSKRLYLPFLFTDYVPEVLKITIEWKPTSDLQSLLPGNEPYGPFVTNGSSHRFFVGQPAGNPIQSHVIEVQCGAAGGFTQKSPGPFVTLLGGFDAPHAEMRDANLGTGFLALLYPIDDADMMSKKVPTIRKKA